MNGYNNNNNTNNENNITKNSTFKNNINLNNIKKSDVPLIKSSVSNALNTMNLSNGSRTTGLKQRRNSDEVGVGRESEATKPPLLPTHLSIPLPPPPPPPPPPVPAVNPHQQPQLNTSMKRINWEKIDKVDDDTIWAKQIDKEKSDNLDDIVKYLELEQKFSTKINTLGEMIRSNVKHSAGILNARKAYNISILLGQTRLDVNEFKRNLIQFDDSKFNHDIIKQLINFAPDNNEMAKYEEYRGLLSDLSEADRFTYQVVKIPAYKARLQAMLFKMTFQEKVSELTSKLTTLRNACSELMKSKKLTQVLEVMLAMGNFMNRGNARVGGAVGFKINFLSQVESTKASDGKTNFLHALASAVEKKFFEACHLSKDLPSIQLAARISDVLTRDELSDMKKLFNDITSAIEEMTSNNKNAGSADTFVNVMQKFLAEASDDIKKLTSLELASQQDINQLINYFGGLPKDLSHSELFVIISQFVSKFEKAVQEGKSMKTARNKK